MEQVEDTELHELMSEKYPPGFVAGWVRLYRAAYEISTGRKKPLIECKKAFDRSHPDYVEWQQIIWQEQEPELEKRYEWCCEYRKEHGVSIVEAMEAHYRSFGY